LADGTSHGRAFLSRAKVTTKIRLAPAARVLPKLDRQEDLLLLPMFEKIKALVGGDGFRPRVVRTNAGQPRVGIW
jgi:hypothetical protein